MILMTEKGPVDEAYFDGYGIEERLLEGVLFRVIVEDEIVKCLGPKDEFSPYMKKFSQRQLAEWEEQIVERVLQDPEDPGLQCPSGNEAWIEGGPTMYRGQPVEIEGITGDQLAKILTGNTKSG